MKHKLSGSNERLVSEHTSQVRPIRFIEFDEDVTGFCY